MTARSPSDRFWSHVTTGDGCWEWIGARTQNGLGYGHLRSGGANLTAHRVSWEMHNGPIPAGLFILHHCDNKVCVRPDHLYLGTRADNTRDALARGLVRAGERSGQAFLTAAAVSDIRASTEQHIRLAERFGVAESTIRKVRTRECWRSVP